MLAALVGVVLFGVGTLHDGPPTDDLTQLLINLGWALGGGASLGALMGALLGVPLGISGGLLMAVLVVGGRTPGAWSLRIAASAIVVAYFWALEALMGGGWWMLSIPSGLGALVVAPYTVPPAASNTRAPRTGPG